MTHSDQRPDEHPPGTKKRLLFKHLGLQLRRGSQQNVLCWTWISLLAYAPWAFLKPAPASEGFTTKEIMPLRQFLPLGSRQTRQTWQLPWEAKATQSKAENRCNDISDICDQKMNLIVNQIAFGQCFSATHTSSGWLRCTQHLAAWCQRSPQASDWMRNQAPFNL